MVLSIIIPTLNEAQSLVATLSHARRAARGQEVEFILSDSSSRDGTVEIARQLQFNCIITGGRNRADSLNRGAQKARGDVLLFLHADSLLPDGFDRLISGALHRNANLVGGAFEFRFGPDEGWTAWQRNCLDLVTLCNRIRYRWTGNFYGDQAIFVRRQIFDRAGGFPETPLMEDIRFCARMRRLGRTAILRPPVLTSPRRFLSRGVIRQFMQDLTLLGCESVGVCPRRLWEHYNRLNHDAHGSFQPDDSSIRFEHATA